MLWYLYYESGASSIPRWMNFFGFYIKLVLLRIMRIFGSYWFLSFISVKKPQRLGKNAQNTSNPYTECMIVWSFNFSPPIHGRYIKSRREGYSATELYIIYIHMHLLAPRRNHKNCIELISHIEHYWCTWMIKFQSNTHAVLSVFCKTSEL